MTGDFEIIEKDGWVFANSVPIFDEHNRKDLDIVFDEARLQTIADNSNRRIQDTGDEVPLIPGHTDDGLPEKDIEVLGWASNFHLGEWGRVSPRKCIFADFKFPADKWEKAKQFPRRSIELWGPDTDNAFIDPIGLLSGSTPQRDLGLLYAKKLNVKTRYTYQLGGEMDKDELVKCFAEMLENSEVGKYVKKCMEAEADSEDEKKDEEPVSNEVEPDGGDKEDKEENDGEGDEKLKNQRDQVQRKYARLESHCEALEKRLAEVERKERVACRKADLLNLEGQGYAFDMADELDSVQDLDVKTYNRHLDKIKKNYKRSPIGVKVNVRDVPAHGLVPQASVDDSGLSESQGRKVSELLLYGKAKSKEEAIKMVINGGSI